ncbi:unnamed protein product, partial [Ectocarpus sp. 12 AP-2014]
MKTEEDRTSRQDQTKRARLISKNRRKKATNQNDRTLVDLKAQLEQEGKKVTNKVLADAANEKGLTTTRGTPWDDKSVSRSVNRNAK